MVEDGAIADSVIVSARDDAAGGLSLLLLDPSLPGLEWIRTHIFWVSGGRASRVYRWQ